MRWQPFKPCVRPCAPVAPAAFPRAIPHPLPSLGPVQPPALHPASELLAALPAPLDRRNGFRLRGRGPLKGLKDAPPSASPHVHHRRLKCVFNPLIGRHPHQWTGAGRPAQRCNASPPADRITQASMAGRPSVKRKRAGVVVARVSQRRRGSYEASSATSQRCNSFRTTVLRVSGKSIIALLHALTASLMSRASRSSALSTSICYPRETC
jgi:hypothetical protein